MQFMSYMFKTMVGEMGSMKKKIGQTFGGGGGGTRKSEISGLHFTGTSLVIWP